MPSSRWSPFARRSACSAREAVVAGCFGSPFEREQVSARVVGVAGERAEREDVVAQEVASADLDRVDAQFERSLIDQPFEQRGRLRPARAAVGAHRCGVGDGDGDVEFDRRERVGALGHPSGTARQERADRRVGAGVTDQAHLQPGEVAVGGAAELRVLDLTAAVGERFMRRCAAAPARRIARCVSPPRQRPSTRRGCRPCLRIRRRPAA